ncbi:MAG: hypothetical protein LBS24_05465 [Clostridiales Family XIII bacterium]|jgi:hypothetical protein|nr:hypothetical protein [Clostridiales Family XIII bacterium]
MPFSTKATLVAFQGDAEKYPCHATLNIGDVVIFTGGEIIGKMCPDMAPPLANALYTMYMTGPRFVPPGNYNLFWYSCNSSVDPSKARYDGTGFFPINRMFETPPHHVADLQDPLAFRWPPSPARSVMKDYTLLCPDGRTGAVFKIEAFDLATGGHAIPYTRRQITVMDRVNKTGGPYPADKIKELYTDFELNEIYPPFSAGMIEMMLEELKLLGFVVIADGKVSVTKSGADRVAKFKTEIPADHAEAMGL